MEPEAQYKASQHEDRSAFGAEGPKYGPQGCHLHQRPRDDLEGDPAQVNVPHGHGQDEGSNESRRFPTHLSKG